jgi:hypothetical protein
MMERSNRLAWGLVAALAVILLAGGGALLTRGIHVTRVELEFVPARSWGLGSRTFTSCGETGRPFIEGRMVRLFLIDLTVR